MDVKTVDHFSQLSKSDKIILLARIKERIDINQGTGCWEWVKGKFKSGYGQISYRSKEFKINMKAHRLMYQLHYNDSFNGLAILHKCNNEKCCNPYHLYHGTLKNNVRDMISCGSHLFYSNDQSGSGNFNASLTDEQVIKARRLYKTNKYTVKEICDIINYHGRRELTKAISGMHYSNLDDIESPSTSENNIFKGKRLSDFGAYKILEDYSTYNTPIQYLCVKYSQTDKNIRRILLGVRFNHVFNDFYKNNPENKKLIRKRKVSIK